MDPRPESEYQDRFQLRVGVLEALSRFRWLVLLTSVVAATVTYGLSSRQADSYQAEASMLLTDPRTSGVFDDAAAGISSMFRYVRNQAEIIESDAVAIRAADLLGTSLTIGKITGSVSAVASRDLDMVTVLAVRPTATEAAALADAVAEAYQGLVAERVQDTAAVAIAEMADAKIELQTRVGELEASLGANPGNAALRAERDAAIAQLVNLNTRIQQIDINMALYGSGVEHFETADIPGSPVSPRPRRNAAAAAVLGLLVAGAYALWRTERSPLAEHRHDPAPVLGAPLLGQVPEFASVGVKGPAPAIHDPDSRTATANDANLAAGAHVLGLLADAGLRTLLLKGGAPQWPSSG